MRSLRKSVWFALAAAVLCASAPVAAGENLLRGGDAEEAREALAWEALKAERYTADRHAGEACFKKAPANYTRHPQVIPIDVNKAYRLSGFFKGLDPNKLNRLSFGLLLLDQDQQPLSTAFFNVMHQTEAELRDPAEQGSKTLVVSSEAYRWGQWRLVAFNAQDDYSDLPNRTATNMISNLTPQGENYEVTLNAPLAASYPVGTKVRMHAGGTAYRAYAVSDTACPQEWTEYAAEIAGVSPVLTDENQMKFLPGTRFVQVFISNTTEILFDDLRLVELEGVTPPPPVEMECPPQLLVENDRADPVYQCMEQARFTVRMKRKGQVVTTAEPEVVLRGVEGREILREKLDLTQGEATISGTLEAPGYISCLVRVKVEGKDYEARAAALFEPEKIQPAVEAPEDFMEFWEASRAELAQIAADVQLTPLPDYSNAQYDSYKISVANLGGTRSYGFLSVPKEGPCAAVAMVPGAGPGVDTPPVSWAQRGVMALSINVFHTELPPYGAGRMEAYRELNKEKWYFLQGLEDRNTYYYRKSILGAVRMVEYLAQRPEWDQQHLVVYGASQGGGFSLILSGLVPQVTALSASMPALCDFGAGAIAGWPKPGSDNPVVRYYDAVNFSRHVRCPALLSVGLVDGMCTPSSIYAAYNQLQGPKRIFNGPYSGHGSLVPMHEFGQYRDTWLRGQLGLEAKTPPTN